MARAYRLIKRSGERAVLLHSGDLKAGDAVRCGVAYGVVVKTVYTPVTEEVVYVLRHVPEAAVSAAYLHTAYAVLLRGAKTSNTFRLATLGPPVSVSLMRPSFANSTCVKLVILSTWARTSLSTYPRSLSKILSAR